jgi:6-pyruvoyltetrahydropterin/6-carboxytetrahydropterin synthase
MPSFRIEVSKDYTIFAAAHFVTYGGDKIEPLHGHNYRTSAAVEGDLDENSYVANFSQLKQALRSVCDRLDHRLLLPTGNPLLQIGRDGEAFVVLGGAKTYRFPAADVIQLPIANTTSELLALWIGSKVEAELRSAGALRPGLRALIVEVEESFGQRAACRLELEWPS